MNCRSIGPSIRSVPVALLRCLRPVANASVSLYGIVEVVLLDVKDARITVVAYARERNWNSLFQYKCDAVAPEGTASQGSSSSVQVVSSSLINIS